MTTHEAVVRVTLKEGVLDPEAKTIRKSLGRIGFEIEDLRTADEYVIEFDSESKEAAREEAEEMCEALLANPTIHDYTVEVR